MSTGQNLFNLHQARHHWRRQKKLQRHHTSLLAIWLILLLIFSGIFSHSFTQVNAQSVDLSLTIARAYICGDGFVDTGEQCDDGNLINGDGCSSVCNYHSGGNGPYLPIIWPLPQIKPPSEKDKTIPAPTKITMSVQIMSGSGGTKALADLNEQTAPTSLIIIPSSQPIFHGQLNQPQALLRLVLRSDIITTIIQADANGQWQWQPPRPLADGPHELLITVYSPDGAEILMEEFSLKFLIDTAAGGRYEQPVEKIVNQLKRDQKRGQELMRDELDFPAPLTYRSLGDYLPVDLRLSANKNYQSGEDLTIRLILNQYQSDAQPEKTFTYTLRDQSGQIIWQQTQTHALQTQTNILTSLKPEDKLTPGIYQLEVSLPIGQTTALASTMFQITAPLSPFYATVQISWLIVAQAAAALLLILLLAIYFEYRYLAALGKMTYPITEDDLRSIGYLS